MKLILLNPEKLSTPYDNKKTEIKKYPQIITTYKTDKKLDSQLEQALLWLIKDEIYGTKKS